MRNEGEGVMRLPLVPYLVVVMSVALMGVVRHLLDALLGEHHPFILFLVPVFLAAWVGGWKPGSLALILGYVTADFFFTHPRYSIGTNSVENQVGLAFYFFVGCVAILQFDVLRRRTAQLFQANTNLMSREAKALQQVEVSLYRLANIVNSSNDAIIGKDQDSIVTDWNKGAEKLFGYSAEEVMGKHIGVILPLDQRDKWHEILEKVKRGVPVEPFETARLRKDGSRVRNIVGSLTDLGRGPTDRYVLDFP